MIVSLLISAYELFLSGDALNILLSGMEKDLSKVEKEHTVSTWKFRRKRSDQTSPLNDDIL
jgi:hypothetical protein